MRHVIILGFVLDLFEFFEESSILRSGLSIDLSVSDLEKLLADVLLGEEWQKSWVPCHRNLQSVVKNEAMLVNYLVDTYCLFLPSMME